MKYKISFRQVAIAIVLVSYALAPHHAVAASPKMPKCDSFITSPLDHQTKPVERAFVLRSNVH